MAKYLALVNSKTIYEYTRADLLLVNIAEHPTDEIRLWKQTGTLVISYEPITKAELEADSKAYHDKWKEAIKELEI
ncbi:MAG: hypothetical protein M0R34_00475 [Candidatus Marinimicrobia bacterium]|jgi:hypothetical protein|nr:hypothetical protein [Candidatus Neomarinimicrobiota bacterium]